MDLHAVGVFVSLLLAQIVLPLHAPTAPSGLTATAVNSTVSLAWVGPTGTDPVDTYIIEAGSVSGAANLANFSTGTRATLFSASGVAAGSYYVRVRASNGAGTSAVSNEALLIVGTGCSAAPGAPAGLTLVMNSGGIVVLSWSAASGAPTTYIVEAGSSSGLSNLANSDLGGTATSLSATTVGAGTYFVRVRGRNACGTSAASNEITLTVFGTSGTDNFIVSSIAGKGPPDVGDGRAASDAVLERPGGVVVGPDGSIYIVDTYNDRIRQLKGGIIRTVAGTGTSEDRTSGDGGLAIQANIRIPRDLAVAADGTLFIADTNHYKIRRIDTTGIITTFAGTGQCFPCPGSRTNLGDGGLAREAIFGFPMAVAVDGAGNVYVADPPVHRVRRIRTDGIIETLAGTGEQGSDGDGGPARQARINGPSSLAILNRTQLLIAGPGPLRVVDLVTNIITTLGPFIGSRVAVDGDRALIFANGPQVLRLDLGTRRITTVAGNGRPGFSGDGGPADRSQVDEVQGLSVDAGGVLYLADAGNNRVRRVGADGTIQTIAGSGNLPGDNTSAENAVIYDSQGIARDARGNIYFSDLFHNTIRRQSVDGLVTTVAGNRRPTYAGDGGHPLAASFSAPRCLQFDHHGQLLFLDQTAGVSVVRAITPGSDGVINGGSDERIITVAGRVADRSEADHGAADGRAATQAVFVAARGFAVDSRDNLYVTDWLDNRIRRVTPGADGILNGQGDEIITTIAGTGRTPSNGDGGPSSQANVSAPNWIAIDPEDNLFAFEETNDSRRTVRRIDAATRAITTVLARPQYGIWSMSAPSTRDLYFADANQFYHLDLRDGSVAVIAGQPEPGFDGDGGDAKRAHFRGAGYFTIDSSGTFLFIDNGNFRLRRFSRP